MAVKYSRAMTHAAPAPGCNSAREHGAPSRDTVASIRGESFYDFVSPGCVITSAGTGLVSYGSPF